MVKTKADIPRQVALVLTDRQASRLIDVLRQAEDALAMARKCQQLNCICCSEDKVAMRVVSDALRCHLTSSPEPKDPW